MAIMGIDGLDMPEEAPDAVAIVGIDVDGGDTGIVTPVKKLMGFIGKANIAEEIDEEDLRKLGCQVKETAERDLDSMHEWSDAIEEGRRIAKQETNGKSQPWEGAANFKTPKMLGASVSFGDRAFTELMRGKNLVKSCIVGEQDENILQSSKNVETYMNWQINVEMEDWRERQETLLYELPNTGTVFKKTYFDSVEKVNRSELIHYPDFIVNQATASMDDCPSFTQAFDMPYYKVLEQQRSGEWLDVDIYPDNSEPMDGSNEEEQVLVAIDNPEKFLEQRCLYDLDGDGYPEPYIVTVHEISGKVVSITPRFYANNVYVRNEAGDTGIIEKVSNPVEVVRIKPYKDITKYEFVKSQDGTFLGLGYLTLLASLCKGINGTTNQLLDSGSLANLQGGFLAKGFRQRMGNLKMKPGSWEETNIDAVNLQNGIKAHQFKEPSMVLYQLRELMNAEANELTVKLDLKGVLAPNAPATTTLALIQESMMPTSAIMKRIIQSQSYEFKCLFQLNSMYIDPKEYKNVLNNPEASYEVDFNMRSFDIIPTANSEMSSKMQRLQQAEVMVGQAQVIGMMGGDVRPIYENWFDAIDADYMVNQVWPDPEQMDAEQQKRMQEMQNKQRQEMQLLGIEIDHKEREVEVKEKLATADIALKNADMVSKLVGLKKTESETILNLEKAESEQVKNQIDMYTASLEGVRNAIEMIEREINATRDVSEVRTAQATQSGIPSGLPPMA